MKYTLLFFAAVICLGLGYLALSPTPAATTAVEKQISNDRFFND